MICFVYFSLDYCDLMKGYYCTPPRKALFIRIVLCFVVFFLYIFFFSINYFFCLFSFYNIKFFSILLSHFYNTTLQLDPHPRLLGLVLQPNPLKLGSWKFNIIINIIKIILRLGVVVRFKALGYSFIEKPNTFRFYFIFNIFYAKKIDP
jgi:hypothetical protein